MQREFVSLNQKLLHSDVIDHSIKTSSPKRCFTLCFLQPLSLVFLFTHVSFMQRTSIHTYTAQYKRKTKSKQNFVFYLELSEMSLNGIECLCCCNFKMYAVCKSQNLPDFDLRFGKRF